MASVLSIGLSSFDDLGRIMALPEFCRLERIGLRWNVFAQRQRVAAGVAAGRQILGFVQAAQMA
jgi:hypothetical protein